jgi:hypothetical protein
VHVISHRGEHDDILNALVAAGFADGLTPASDTLGPMQELTPLLLEVLSAHPEDARASPDVGPGEASIDIP